MGAESAVAATAPVVPLIKDLREIFDSFFCIITLIFLLVNNLIMDLIQLASICSRNLTAKIAEHTQSSQRERPLKLCELGALFAFSAV